jgi:ribosomal protein L11 methyltransferase
VHDGGERAQPTQHKFKVERVYRQTVKFLITCDGIFNTKNGNFLMSWIEITCEVKESLAAALSTRLESLGALAVSYYDATGTPILEPTPGETPFWSHMQCVGLFLAEVDLNAIKMQLMQSFPDLIFEAKPLEDQDWTRAWLAHFRPLSFGSCLRTSP